MSEKVEAEVVETTPAVETNETTEAPAKAESMISATEEKTEEKVETKEEKPAVQKYELKLPEGSKLDTSVLAKVEALAKEKGWSNERAQEAIDDRHNAEVEIEQRQQQVLQNLNDKTWKEELVNDPEFGGEKFEQNGHLAHKAVERFGGKEFAEELKAMKLNHHPKLFRLLARVGRAMESDEIVVTNNQNNKGTLPPEQRMYPNMYKTKES